MIQEKIWTKNFIFLSLSNSLMALTFYILATVFPLYVKSGLNGNEQQMGLAITIYVVGIILIRPFSGYWVDQFGKKKIAIIGTAIFLFASICYFGANGIFLFLVIRFIHGMSYAIASTATNTAAISIIPYSRQGEGIGYFSMFMSLANVIGPALGLFLWKDENINVLLLTVCIISALAFLFALGARMSGETKERNIAPMKMAMKNKQRFQWKNIIEPKALPISIISFFLGFSYSSLSGFLPSFTNEIHQSHVTGTFFIVFAMMIVVFRPVVGKVFDRYKEHYLYYPSSLLFVIGMLLLSQANSGGMVLLAGIIMGIGYGALYASFQALAVKLSPKDRSGAATATFFLLSDGGYGVGSYFMGLTASVTNYRTIYMVAALITILSVIMYYVIYHRPQAKTAKTANQAN